MDKILHPFFDDMLVGFHGIEQVTPVGEWEINTPRRITAMSLVCSGLSPESLELLGNKGILSLQMTKDLNSHEIDRLRTINAELAELLSDIVIHLEGGGNVYPGSMIFAEDKPAKEVIRAALAKARGE